MSSTLSPAPPSTRTATAVLVAGPALLLAGVIGMMTPTWNHSHLVFLAGTLVMLPAAAALHGLLGDTAPPWSAGRGSRSRPSAR